MVESSCLHSLQKLARIHRENLRINQIIIILYRTYLDFLLNFLNPAIKIILLLKPYLMVKSAITDLD